MINAVFTVVDYLVLISSLVLSILIGVYYAFIKKQETNEDLLVGGRSMSVIPVAFSMMITYTSAILVLGTPAEVYNHGTLLVAFVTEVFFFVPLSCYLFLPVLYKLELTSINEYLEWRFDSRFVRMLASATFIVEMIMSMGLVLYAPTLAMETFLGIPTWASILVVGGCGTVYTAIGGLRAVVWTDVFQAVVVLLGMVVILIKSLINVGGFARAFEIASEHGRLQLVDWNPSIFVRQTTWSIFFGSGLITLSLCSTHQPQVQRYSSMGSLKQAVGAMFLSIPIYCLVFLLAMLTGLTIFANYAGCDPVKRGLITRVDEIVPFFVVEELSMVTGMMGLFLACLFSASLSSVSSGFNSLAAVTWEDFCSKMKYFENMSEKKQANITKLISFSYGILAIGFAFLATGLGEVFAASFTISGAIIGPLGGVFILGLFLPFVNKWGASVGMIVGHAITIWICVGSFLMGGQHTPLPTNADHCPNATMTNFTTILPSSFQWESTSDTTTTMIPSDEDIGWPEKIYTISYILYAMIGTTVTVFFGIVVSLVTGPSSMPERKEKLINPAIVRFCKYLRRRKYRNMIYTAVEVKMENKGENLKIKALPKIYP